MLLARKDESRHRMSIDKLVGYRAIVTAAILSMTALNLSNVWTNETILSARPIGSVLLSPNATFWTGGARGLIPEWAFFATSSSWAASAAVTPGVLSWSDGVPWFIQVRVWTENS